MDGIVYARKPAEMFMHQRRTSAWLCVSIHKRQKIEAVDGKLPL